MAWWDDIKQSSLYTGAGTPWGEGQRDPYQAKFKAFNPDEYQGMDTTALGHALRQDIGKGTARARGRMQGALQRGGGGGADLISGMAGLEAEQGQAENTLSAKLAAQDYENRYRQYKDYLGNEYRLEDQDKERYAREDERRNAPWQAVGSAAGGLLGALGGGLGSAVGSELGSAMLGGSKKKKKQGDY